MALPAGAQFGLSAESARRDRDIVFVKLTDAALKAIEDFIRSNRGKLGPPPTIQFLPGNEGKMCIPAAGGGSGQQSSAATFHFSLSSNADIEGPQGSFECVRSGGARRLESCGPLPRKMRVHANDDSYEATKNAMAKTVAEEQSKFTRVIKPNQTDIGRRVKVRASHVAPHAAAHAAHAAHAAPPTLPSSGVGAGGGGGVPAGAAATPAASSAPAPHAAPAQRHAPPAQQHPPHQRPPGNPDLARRPIKERLIQLLALRPYKKPELYSRLTSEGIKDKERAVINTVLQQISSLKDNCYRLHRHIWNDVIEDWQFYTEDEKRMLKRRKPQNLTPPLSSDSTNSLSPRASPGGSKRAPGEAGDTPASKKQRISHYRRTGAAGAGDAPRAAGSPSSGYATAGSGASSGERHASDNEDDRAAGKKDHGYTLSFNTAKAFSSSPSKQNGVRSSPPVETNHVEVNSVSIANTETLENDTDNGVDMSAPETEQYSDEDIESQWPQITSVSERRRYKKEFAQKFAEYESVYEHISRVAGYFTRLEHRLHRAPPHSPSHQDVRKQILEEYRRMQRDKSYQREKRRSQYLHRKLTHIKRMVQEYDAQLVPQMKGERVGASASTTQAY